MDTMHPLSKPELVVSWICRVIAAVILLQIGAALIAFAKRFSALTSLARRCL